MIPDLWMQQDSKNCRNLVISAQEEANTPFCCDKNHTSNKKKKHPDEAQPKDEHNSFSSWTQALGAYSIQSARRQEAHKLRLCGQRHFFTKEDTALFLVMFHTLMARERLTVQEHSELQVMMKKSQNLIAQTQTGQPLPKAFQNLLFWLCAQWEQEPEPSRNQRTIDLKI